VLDKAVAILGAVERGAGTLPELVTATGLSRATAHRLATALAAHRLLDRSPAGRWVLGPRLAELGGSVPGRAAEARLREAAVPVLRELRDATGESAQLYLRLGDRRVCLESVESAHELRTIVRVGASLPLFAGSAGKVVLAWADEIDVDRLLGSAAPLTPSTPSPDRLRRQLPSIRRRGWAESVGEREAGVASVSAPVLGADGSLVAVISVSGPIPRIGRFPGRRFASQVVGAARAVEARLAASA
jgi:DNA-binding IclR family transcriptional regulator